MVSISNRGDVPKFQHISRTWYPFSGNVNNIGIYRNVVSVSFIYKNQYYIPRETWYPFQTEAMCLNSNTFPEHGIQSQEMWTILESIETWYPFRLFIKTNIIYPRETWYPFQTEEGTTDSKVSEFQHISRTWFPF